MYLLLTVISEPQLLTCVASVPEQAGKSRACTKAEAGGSGGPEEEGGRGSRGERQVQSCELLSDAWVTWMHGSSRYQEEARENRGHSRRWGMAEQRQLEEQQRLREETLASKDREKEMDAIKVCL